jgi:hypothetical protein
MSNSKSEQIVFRCSKNLKEQMKDIAKSENLSISDIIRHICDNWLEAGLKSK